MSLREAKGLPTAEPFTRKEADLHMWPKTRIRPGPLQDEGRLVVPPAFVVTRRQPSGEGWQG